MQSNNVKITISSLVVILLSAVVLLALTTSSNLGKVIDFYIPIKVLAVIDFACILAWAKLNYLQLHTFLQTRNLIPRISKISLIIFLIAVSLLALFEFLFGNDRSLTTSFTDREIYQNLVDIIFLVASVTSAIYFFFNNKINAVEQSDRKRLFVISFIVIAVVFIVSRLVIPVIFSGSYIDEYFHVLTANSLLKTGQFAQIYQGELYTRGAYVSALLALLFKFFGSTIYVAKLLPALVGICNFFLLFRLSSKVIKNNLFSLLLMVGYTFYYLTLFDHFYIRMYVFYELALLVSLNVWFSISIYIAAKKYRKALLAAIGLVIGLLAFTIASNDDGSFTILIFNFAIVVYFVFSNRMMFLEDFNKIFKLLYRFRVSLFTFALTVGVLLLHNYIGDKIYNLFFGTISNSVNVGYKYDNLFINLNGLFTILFLLSAIALIKSKSHEVKMTVVGGLTLFFLHITSTKDLQLTRTIMYFAPIFLLLAFYSLSTIKVKKAALGLLILLSGIYIVLNFPAGFQTSPNLPSEVYYIDYQKGFDYLRQNCSPLTTFSGLYSSSMGAILYNFNVEQTFRRNDQLSSHPEFSYVADTNQYVTTYGNIPVISTSNFEVKEVSGSFTGSPICVIYTPVLGGVFYSNKEAQNLNALFSKVTVFNNLVILQ